jgi:membrane-associated phospholipid phosphatase
VLTNRAILSPADRITLVMLGLLAVAAARIEPVSPQLLGNIAALILGLLVVAWWGSRSRAGEYVHLTDPIPVVYCVYAIVAHIIRSAHSPTLDARLAAVDERYFSSVMSWWLGAFGRPAWFTDVMSVAYASLYAVPLIVVGALLHARRLRDLESFASVVLVCVFLTYVGYVLFPAVGPRLPADREAAILGGGRITAGVIAAIHAAETNRFDAFPSGHTSAALVYLAAGWRLFPRWRIPLTLCVASIVFSTVYLHMHYIIDLFAGAAVAGLSVALAPFVVPSEEHKRTFRSVERVA